MKFDILNLNLLSPLYYVPAEKLEPFGCQEGIEGEKLFCFELDEAQYGNIEPDKEKLFARLIFCGEAAEETTAESLGEAFFKLPQGKYLFSQKRELLNRELIIAMAIDIQQEGLWQRLKPGRRLYLRYLFEDGKWVTQLFRPVQAVSA